MAVREGMLVLLAERPRHGYELKTAFEERTGGLWQINTGQVYTTIDRLLRDGLVEPIDPDASADRAGSDDRRRPYQLTPAGEKVARDWLRARVGADAPPRDELLMKVLMAAESDLDDARAVIDAQRHELLSQLQAIRQGPGANPDTLAARLCLDARIVRIESDLRWLDLCVDRIKARGKG